MRTTVTEQRIRKMIAERGHFVGVGKRVYAIAEKLEAANAIPHARYRYSCYNLNGPEFRSQWKSPRARTQYEVAISIWPPELTETK